MSENCGNTIHLHFMNSAVCPRFKVVSWELEVRLLYFIQPTPLQQGKLTHPVGGYINGFR